MKKLKVWLICCGLATGLQVSAQDQEHVGLIQPFDYTQAYSEVYFKGARLDLVDGTIFEWTFGGRWAFGNYRNQLRLDIPMMRTNYGNIEQRVGFGDIVLGYLYNFHNGVNKKGTLTTSSFGLDIRFPTGEPDNGQGLGSLIFTPSWAFGVWLHPQVAAFTSLRYSHSTSTIEGEWTGGYPGGGYPSAPTDNFTTKIRNLWWDVTGVVGFNEGAWFGLGLITNVLFTEPDYTLNIRPELGKIWNDRWRLSLAGTVFLAGRQRLQNQIDFVFSVFPGRKSQ